MNTQQFQRMSSGTGFIAALDQSGGSTPKALATYGIDESTYSSEVEMYDLVHQMRTRLITSPVFTSERILAAILFKQTMRSQIRGLDTADYLWQEKGIVPLLKIDNGLADEADGVQLMKPIPELNELLDEAKSHNIFGTKMRSVIKAKNSTGIQTLVKQQFAFAKQICATGLVPIVEPEVDIHTDDKAAIEAQLMQALLEDLDLLGPDELVMLKLTLPTEPNLYQALAKHPNVVRVVALSGGYERTYANELLAQNKGIIASFSRALSEGLYAYQSDEAFNDTLNATIEATYQASLT